MLETERRQREDPTYQFRTPLPPTAHPAVGPDEVELASQEQVAMEASIGEVAPEGR